MRSVIIMNVAMLSVVAPSPMTQHHCMGYMHPFVELKMPRFSPISHIGACTIILAP
jgi:hypothetical protein